MAVEGVADSVSLQSYKAEALCLHWSCAAVQLVDVKLPLTVIHDAECWSLIM